ncbi:MAG: tryptophan 2,3-dioxygenase family protein [Sphingobacteriales bacterium]|jgi:tryptophan 2,3-dioxygenase|nr:tryptophan 2,3-dioxygenase family protein [Sphingobacteriales bacterium]
MSLPQPIVDRIKLLEEKYTAMGQDLLSYLDGLLYADVCTYWDYIRLDTLLSLQQPRTQFPDETVFIMYHQVTELYFKLALHELKQIVERGPDAAFMTERLQRVNRYFSVLTSSFDIMVEGMEREQFQKFRMSLLPASGFQSAQYRMIEIYATDFIHLVDKDVRESMRNGNHPVAELFEHIYWKAGATELSSGKKTLTLRQFEEKYSVELVRLAESLERNNMLALYHALPEADRNSDELRVALKQLDVNVNINWPLVHYKSAVRYLQANPADIAATGGTNWQKYLPPRFQKRIFYPELWSAEEQENWGKIWVENVLSSQVKS